MQFLVKLIQVIDTSDQDARDDLSYNCDHVFEDYWLFEGNLEALHKGITYSLIEEAGIDGYGDLKGSEIIKMVEEVYLIPLQGKKIINKHLDFIDSQLKVCEGKLEDARYGGDVHSQLIHSAIKGAYSSCKESIDILVNKNQ